jgi:hypothetical protein
MKTINKVALIATAGMLATILMASVAYAAAPELRLPYTGGQKMYISQAYGVYTHTGIDYYALDFTLNGCDAWDKPVLAVADGTITKVDPGHSHGENNYGNNVVITHEGGYTSLYGHLNQILVQKDQKVVQGTTIGTVGNTGFAPGTACALYPGTHLHFRILYNGVAYKPEPMSTLKNFVAGQWPLSDNYVHPITVTYPNGGESWRVGSTQTIKWSYTGNPGSTAKIELVKSTGAATTLANWAPIGSGGKGSYSFWLTQFAGSYKVRITTSSGSDMSNWYFTIS